MYDPSTDGYFCLIASTTQDGATRRLPLPSLPWTHRMNCLYAALRKFRCSYSTASALQSHELQIATCKTVGCKQVRKKVSYVVMHTLRPQQIFSIGLLISLHRPHLHHGKLLPLCGGSSLGPSKSARAVDTPPRPSRSQQQRVRRTSTSSPSTYPWICCSTSS